jgi:hypothetical protein
MEQRSIALPALRMAFRPAARFTRAGRVVSSHADSCLRWGHLGSDWLYVF